MPPFRFVLLRKVQTLRLNQLFTRDGGSDRFHVRADAHDAFARRNGTLCGILAVARLVHGTVAVAFRVRARTFEKRTVERFVAHLLRLVRPHHVAPICVVDPGDFRQDAVGRITASTAPQVLACFREVFFRRKGRGRSNRRSSAKADDRPPSAEI